MSRPVDILAIVGSQHWPDGSEERIKAVIRTELQTNRPDLVISGKAAGVDTWAIEVAKELGIEFEEFPPKNPRWEPDGYKARNMKIAYTCTRMLAIRSLTSKRGGTIWTANYAASIGKPVDLPDPM